MALKGVSKKIKQHILVSAILAGLLLIIVNSAVWVNRYIFDNNNFTSIATQSLTSESSRDAMAQEITDQALANYPVVKNVVNNYAVNFISGLLDTQQSHVVLEKVVSKLQIVLTSKDHEPIVINLSEIKVVLAKLIDLSGNAQNVNVDPSKIPDQIVLLNPQNIPNFYQYGIAFSWLAVLAGIGALILIALPYLKYTKHYLGIMLTQGLTLTVVGLLALLLGPLFKPPVMANIDSGNLRIVVGNLYDAFFQTFNQQSLLLVYVGLIIAALSGVIFLVHYLRDRSEQNKKPKK